MPIVANARVAMLDATLGKSLPGTGGAVCKTLASRSGLWHGDVMTNEPERQAPKAGGALIAIFTLVGAGIGIALGQPSMGVVGGVGFGTGLAILIWLKDRKR